MSKIVIHRIFDFIFAFNMDEMEAHLLHVAAWIEMRSAWSKMGNNIYRCLKWWGCRCAVWLPCGHGEMATFAFIPMETGMPFNDLWFEWNSSNVVDYWLVISRSAFIVTSAFIPFPPQIAELSSHHKFWNLPKTNGTFCYGVLLFLLREFPALMGTQLCISSIVFWIREKSLTSSIIICRQPH